MTQLVWEKLKEPRSGLGPALWRAKVLGGWLIWGGGSYTGVIFYPDPQHQWDGGSLP